jgi:TonB-linked SusC/RagA family outer membrane protein
MKKFSLLLAVLVYLGLQVTFAQTREISGTVTSADDRSTIPGASVVVKGTTVGIITDMDGKFSLKVPQDATTLVVSFVGMASQDVALTSQTSYSIALQSDNIAVDEVVVTALGIKREKKALGYATQEVKNEDLVKTGNHDLAGAMQGKIAGIDIKPSSGMPGASSQITIRGSRSFEGDNTPLYVIDGMPIRSTWDYDTEHSVTGSDLSNRAIDINPADIESINILKGQAAAALYGIRASNGVIIITTKSGKGNKIGKPVVNISHTSSFAQVSRTPDYQTTYAQGNDGAYNPKTSTSWGPKIVDLPNDATYGGNSNDHPGKFRVPQLEGLADVEENPELMWVTPQVFNNWDDYFQTGYTSTNSVNVSQATKKGNFAIGLTNTTQDGIALNTGMDRWNAKGSAATQLNDNFKVGFSANYIKSNIDKLSGGNDGSLAGVLAAPASYNLKGYPNHAPGDPYKQVYYRSFTFDNPYWIPDNNVFNEKIERFFGNGYVEYAASITNNLKTNIRYQIGTDTYSTHLQDIFGYGSRDDAGYMDNFGTTSSTINSLFIANFDWTISDDLLLNVTLGNEIDHRDWKTYEQSGIDFNFGGWSHIGNAKNVTAYEEQYSDRTVGTFGSALLSYKSLLFLNVTGRKDVVSTMPRDNRSFVYPSASLSLVASELAALKDIDWLSFAKLRVSYAEVGQAGRYFKNFFTDRDYSGSWWSSVPVQYPVNSVNSYISNNVQFDPALKPQNTKSYEFGIDLKFFNNRVGIDYTYSQQDVEDQIFRVPLAASTGAAVLRMNGGSVQTKVHEAIIYATPVQTKDFRWDINVNYSKVDNMVLELKEGVESIFLGGFVTPQVRAGIGDTYPVIYGDSYKRNEAGQILVVDNPGASNHGMPSTGEPGVIGKVSPDFILGGTNTFTYKSLSLSAVFEWKQGGQMYSGSNGLLDLYGMSKRTEDRESTFIFDGYKEDGTPNDIARGGPTDPLAYQTLYRDVLANIDEYYIHDNSFVKLRELSLRFQSPKKLYKTLTVGVSVFTRNVLLWTALENLDPETSQGNNNIGGSFERFTLPQTTSYGFGIDLTF